MGGGYWGSNLTPAITILTPSGPNMSTADWASADTSGDKVIEVVTFARYLSAHGRHKDPEVDPLGVIEKIEEDLIK